MIMEINVFIHAEKYAAFVGLPSMTTTRNTRPEMFRSGSNQKKIAKF